MGKKLTAKKRSTGQSFRNPSPAFRDFKRGLTGYEGSLPPRYLGCRPAVPGPSASSTPRLLFRRGLPLRVSAFLARRAAACPCPPSTPCPGQGCATHVLLHFCQVLLGEGRRGGLHGGGGSKRFFRVRELLQHRPARLGTSASG